jgi:hypothetical protein
MMASWLVVFVLIVDIEENYRELKQMTEASVLRRDENFIVQVAGLSVSRCHYNVKAALAHTVTSIIYNNIAYK